MKNYIERNIAVGQPEYGRAFWNAFKGADHFENDLNEGRKPETGSYELPRDTGAKLEREIASNSVFRPMASVIENYDGPAHIIAADSDDVSEFVAEGESFPLFDTVNDFTRIDLNRYKLVSLAKLPEEFIRDAGFDVERYIVRRFGKSIAKAEEKAFITGNGVTEPTGILHATNGAALSHRSHSLCYGDILSLYYAVDAKYRANAVWLMNDKTALELRKLTDETGHYIWNANDDTLLGKKVVISEFMPDATGGNKPIAFGDFSYYWIIDRDPVSMKVLRERFALNGQIGYLAFRFIDGKLVRSDAVKVIQIVPVPSGDDEGDDENNSDGNNTGEDVENA